MSKEKGKGGTGRGTDKKGWNRWKAGVNKAKSAKPYTSKRSKKAVEPKNDNQQTEEASGWTDA